MKWMLWLGVAGTISFVDSSRIPLKSMTIIEIAEQMVAPHVANV